MSRRQRVPGRGIDWGQVHLRLEQASAALRDALSPAPEQARAVLEARARALAKVPGQELQASETLEVVTFRLDRDRYALEARHVREVIQTANLTIVPGAPVALAGVLNLRGEMLAVFELAELLQTAGRTAADRSRVLVLGGERSEFGVLADAVDEVVRVRVADIFPPPPSLAGPGAECLRGVTADGLSVLDGETLLHDRRLVIDQRTGRDH